MCWLAAQFSSEGYRITFCCTCLQQAQAQQADVDSEPPSQRPSETEEGDAAAPKQLGLARHQQHQHFQQQRQEQQQQQQQQKQEQQQQEQEQPAAAASGLHRETSKRNRWGMIGLAIRGKRNHATESSEAGNDLDAPGRPQQAPASESSHQAPEPVHLTSASDDRQLEESQDGGHNISAPEQIAHANESQSPSLQSASQVQNASLPVAGPRQHHSYSQDPQQSGQSSVVAASQPYSMQPVEGHEAGGPGGLGPHMQLQQQIASLSEAAERMMATCLQLQTLQFQQQ